MDLGKLTALQLAEKIKQHQISVLDGVKYVFDQIEAKEDKVHAYLDTYKKEAYARAKEVQKGIEDGTYTGPLAGVPIAIKDKICIKGKSTTCASNSSGSFTTSPGPSGLRGNRGRRSSPSLTTGGCGPAKRKGSSGWTRDTGGRYSTLWSRPRRRPPSTPSPRTSWPRSFSPWDFSTPSFRTRPSAPWT